MSAHPADVIVGSLLAIVSLVWLVLGWREANRTISAIDQMLKERDE